MWVGCVNLRLVYDTKNEEMFSMTDHHCEGLEHGFFHIFIPATTGTYVQSITNAVNVLVKTFGPENIYF